MKKIHGLFGIALASGLLGLCSQSALADDNQDQLTKPYTIEKSGDVSRVQRDAESECQDKFGEVIESYETGPRNSVYSNFNGYERNMTLTAWKVVCRRKHIEKMPAFVVALGGGDLLSSTLETHAREQLSDAAAKDGKNCASQVLQTVNNLKQDPDVSSAMKDLEGVMGPISIGISLIGNYSSVPVLESTDINKINELFVLTPYYEKIGKFDPQYRNADRTIKSREKQNELFGAGCIVEKKDIIDLLNQVAKQKKIQKDQDGAFSNLEKLDSLLKPSNKLVDRAIASTRMAKPVKSITATFVDSPEVSAGIMAQ
jgi:hypothetical protein